MPVFELGFAIISLMKQPRVISGLDAQSPAAQAGLREGDKVIASTPLDTAQETPDQEMSVTIERDGKPVEIRFKPKGKQIVDGYQWVRVKGMPDDNCRI
jgi:predicted metalloprotease with PDZ domain